MPRFPNAERLIVSLVAGDTGIHLFDMLKDHDLNVVRVDTSDNFWTLYKAQKPVLIVLTPVLRWGDGLELCRRVRRNNSHTNLLMLVDEADERDYEQMLAAGVNEWIGLPLSRTLLLHRVAQLMATAENSAGQAVLPQASAPSNHETRDSEHKYRLLFNAANDAITIVDAQTRRFLDANRRALSWLGYSLDELRALTFDEVHPPHERGDQRMIEEELSLTGKLVYEQVYQRKDGRKIHVEVSSRVIRFDGRAAFLNIARDITERYNAEQERQRYLNELELRVSQRTAELAQANEQLRSVINSANCLLWYATVVFENDEYDWDTQVFSEEAAQRFLPVVMHEGQSYVDAWRASLPQEDRRRVIETAYNALRNNYSHYNQEYRCRTDQDELRWIYEEVRLKPLAANRWSLVGVCTDITAAKLYNERLEQDVATRTADLRKEIEVRMGIEKSMSESEARYRALVEHAPEAIVVFDANTEQYVDVNTNAARLFGVTPTDVLRAGPMDFSPPTQPDGQASDEAMRAYIREAVAGRTPVFEWTYQTAQGQRVICEVRLLLLPTSGEVLVRGSITDITERKRIQQAEEQQRQIQQTVRESAAELSRTLQLGEVFDRIIDYIEKVMPPHESVVLMMMDSSDYGLVHIERDPGSARYSHTPLPKTVRLEDYATLSLMYALRKPLAISDTEGHPLWKDVPSVSGWMRSYVAAPVIGEDMRVLGFITLGSAQPDTFTDDHATRLMIFANQAGIAIQNARLYEDIRISASEMSRLADENRLALENERFRLKAILEALREGVLFTDVDWRTVYVNRSLSELTGYSPHELTGAAIFTRLMALPTDFGATLQGMITAELNERGYWQYDSPIRRKNNSEFDGHLMATRVNGPRGEMIGTVTVLRDVSEAKRLEQQKSQFIANASHELRTPLANLKTRIYLARKRPERADEHLAVIESVTDRMRALVEALLDLKRFEHGQIPVELRAAQLQPLILEVIQMQAPEAEARRQQLTSDLPDEPLCALLDPLRFSQIITNLVTNAILYTPEGGRIRVDLRREEACAVIGIHDNGRGIPERILPNIFKPFVRGSEKSSGSGLGLAITKEIVELHKGEINVTSKADAGTTFTVRLPLVIPPCEDTEALPVEADARGASS